MSVPRWTTRYVYLVKSEFASPSQEEAWNNWYDTVHVPDMLTVPGVRAARRYRDTSGGSHYIAVYEIDSPEVFEHPRYAEVTGWGEWQQHIVEWTRTITEVVMDEQPFAGGAGAVA